MSFLSKLWSFITRSKQPCRHYRFELEKDEQGSLYCWTCDWEKRRARRLEWKAKMDDKKTN